MDGVNVVNEKGCGQAIHSVLVTSFRLSTLRSCRSLPRSVHSSFVLTLLPSVVHVAERSVRDECKEDRTTSVA